jgi:hypothetical protein
VATKETMARAAVATKETTARAAVATKEKMCRRLLWRRNPAAYCGGDGGRRCAAGLLWGTIRTAPPGCCSDESPAAVAESAKDAHESTTRRPIRRRGGRLSPPATGGRTRGTSWGVNAVGSQLGTSCRRSEE